MTRPERLGAQERDRIYVRRIRPDLFAGSSAATTPVALIVAGQPGAGVPTAASRLRRELLKTAGPAVHLCADRLRAYHPADRTVEGPNASWLELDVADWFDRAMQDARQHRVHLLIENELDDGKASLPNLAVALRKAAYVVQTVFVSTDPAWSRILLLARHDLGRGRGLPCAVTTILKHDAAVAQVRLVMGQLEDRRAVDGLRIIDVKGLQFYENRLIDGEWVRAARAQATLDVERDRVPPPRELVQLAMRWETLVRRLVNDPAVPRDLASQVLRWRDEEVARCDATPPGAQMLQWAREGAAFRAMERREFEKEFPHHGRAVKSLGLAILEAEKYPQHEGTRLVLHARENIAQRIERGDMARIAARDKPQEPPTR
ncbi:zeta toxin family protein [Variovorax sp. J22R115]|uniref:zeta toxin family protein n=1 Tax=Variovorax sp. J22R115 TaxID=3053509 RepID=UPI002578674A|nr:zeta toxin family protein [Variovorax sp. J22R115]MDM0049767.1 zeta toxin family protein [Variovorax sp. J22R115]